MQSSRIRGAAGDPLPTVFESLEDADTRLLRSQLTLIAGGPGSLKSTLALNIALKSGVNALYLSDDSDAFTQASRGVSVLTGSSLSASGSSVRNNALEAVRAELAGAPIRFAYDPAPTLDVIETQVEAYEEVYGAYPELIVVDNVTNVRMDAGQESDPSNGLEWLMDYLHSMARHTEACVLGLHHVTGSFNDSDRSIPLSGVKGQIGRVPELILTLHRPAPDILAVSTVKNRAGKADASGMTFVELAFDADTMSIRDLVSSAGHGGSWNEAVF